MKKPMIFLQSLHEKALNCKNKQMIPFRKERGYNYLKVKEINGCLTIEIEESERNSMLIVKDKEGNYSVLKKRDQLFKMLMYCKSNGYIPTVSWDKLSYQEYVHYFLVRLTKEALKNSHHPGIHSL